MNVRLPSEIQRLAPFLAVAVLAIAGLLLVTRGVGGGGGGGTDAQQVIDRAFAGGNGNEAKSGRMTMSASVALQGGGQASGNFGVEANGRFDQADGAPKLDLDMKVSGGGEDGEIGLLVDGARGYLNFEGQWYELPGGTFKPPAEGAQGQGVTAALGFDPRGWLRNPRSEGTAQVGGVETDHVSADVDVQRMVSDLTGLADRAGQADRLPPEVREGLDDAVKQARVDLYVGREDGVLHKLTVSAQLDANLGEGTPPVRGDVKFDVEVSDLGKPQKIEAPRDAVPASELEGIPGLQGLGSAGSGSGSGSSAGAGSGTGGSGSAGKGTSGSGTGGSTGGASTRKRSEQAYVNCVQQAQDAAALDKCQALIP
jgi:hypothetical protein